MKGTEGGSLETNLLVSFTAQEAKSVSLRLRDAERTGCNKSEHKLYVDRKMAKR